MEQYKKQFDEYMDKLDNALNDVRRKWEGKMINVAYMNMISEKVHMRKCYLALIVVLNFVFVLVFSLGCKILG